VKFGWGGFGIDPALDRDCLTAIREALGPERELMVDPGWYVEENGRPRTRTRSQTLTMLETISEFHPYWIEDFVHPDRLVEYRELQEDFPSLRFAAGEQQATTWDFERLMSEGAVNVLQPDLSRCGGLSTAVAIAPEAEKRGIEIVTHSWLTDFLHAYSLHFLCAPSIGDLGGVQRRPESPQPWRRDEPNAAGLRWLGRGSDGHGHWPTS